MNKETARKPVASIDTYLKYGFVITKQESYHCPRCSHILNARPGYQPNYCSQCGQHVTFEGIVWKPDRTVGYLPINQRGGTSNE